MFDAGFAELILVFVIGLLILGPERLPRVAAQLGRWIARARRTATQLRYELEREIALEELRRKQAKPPRPAAGDSAAPVDAARAARSAASTDSNEGVEADPEKVPGDAAAVASPERGATTPPADPSRSVVAPSGSEPPSDSAPVAGSALQGDAPAPSRAADAAVHPTSPPTQASSSGR